MLNVSVNESDPGSSQFHKGNAAFLDQSSNESLRAAKSRCSASDIQKRSSVSSVYQWNPGPRGWWRPAP